MSRRSFAAPDRRALAALAGALLALAGCDVPTAGVDAGRDAALDVHVDGGDLRTPRIPWLAEGAPTLAPVAPSAWACPAGWRAIDRGDGARACDPFPEGGRPACEEGSVWWPGAASCAPLGPACTAEWPDVSGARVRHVQPGASGGDGSRALPFGTLAEALAGATSGDVIALSRGAHEVSGTIAVPAGVTLVGACIGDTSITTVADAPSEAMLEPRGEGVVIRDLTLGPSARGAARARAGTSVSLSGVRVREASYVALLADGGALDATDVLVEATREARGFGIGLATQYGGALRATRVLVRGGADRGVYAVDPGTTLELTDVIVEDVAATARADSGVGIEVQTEARATLGRVVVERVHTIGLFALREGVVDASSIVVRGTRVSALDRFASGVGVQESASMTVRGAWLVHNAGRGANVADGSLVLEDTLVDDTDIAGTEEMLSAGVVAWDAASFSMRRSAVLGSRGLGVLVSGTTATLEDLVIADTEVVLDDGTDGDGLFAQDGAELTVERALLVRNPIWNVIAVSDGTRLTLRDARVVDGDRGVALVSLDGATLRAERAIVERARTWGVAAQRGTLELFDVAISGTLGVGDELGGGVLAQVASTVRGERVLVEGNQWVGIAAVAEGASASLTDVVVRRTELPECDEGGCDNTVGVGMLARDGASLALERFVSEGNATVGLQIAIGGSLDARHGVVRDQPIGVNVQVAGYDLSRLTEDVVFDNDVNLDARELPVPDTSGAPTAEPETRP